MACFEEEFDIEAALAEAIEAEAASSTARGSADVEPEVVASSGEEEAVHEVDPETSTAAEVEVHEVEGGGAEARGVDVDNLELPEEEALPTEGRAFTLRAKRVGLTYAQCPIPPEEAAKMLMGVKGTVGLRVAAEKHADGTPHLHVFLQKGQERKDGNVYDLTFEGKTYHPNIRPLKSAKHACNWHFYIEKESKPVQAGTYKVPALGGRGKKAVDLLKTATTSGVDEALKEYIENDGKLERVAQVETGLRRMLQPAAKKPRWLDEAESHSIVLRAWQKDLLAKLDSPPRKRQLFWVSGPPDCGKSTFAAYLAKHFGKDEIFYAGKSVSYDGLVWMYKQESIVVFDFPKSFDWIKMGQHAASCIEKFTEFGNMMVTPKYTGKKVRLLGHCIVFANIESIPELQHRDVVEVNLLHLSEAQRNRV